MDDEKGEKLSLLSQMISSGQTIVVSVGKGWL